MTEPVREIDKDLLLAIQNAKGCRKSDIKTMIANGANPDAVDPTSGLRAIHIAARRGSLTILKALLEDERVYADAVDPRGKVPYEWAQEFNHSQAEMLLVNEIIEKPNRYSLQSVREAKYHLQIRNEL